MANGFDFELPEFTFDLDVMREGLRGFLPQNTEPVDTGVLEEVEQSEKQASNLTDELNNFTKKHGDYLEHTPEERKELSKLYQNIQQKREDLKNDIVKAKTDSIKHGANLIEAKPDDIDKGLANRAYSNTSWSPERRGESRRKC